MTVAQWAASGLICHLCHSTIDGFEPGYRRLCERCKAAELPLPRRRGPRPGAAAEPAPDAPELVELDACDA